MSADPSHRPVGRRGLPAGPTGRPPGRRDRPAAPRGCPTGRCLMPAGTSHRPVGEGLLPLAKGFRHPAKAIERAPKASAVFRGGVAAATTSPENSGAAARLPQPFRRMPGPLRGCRNPSGECRDPCAFCQRRSAQRRCRFGGASPRRGERRRFVPAASIAGSPGRSRAVCEVNRGGTQS